MTAPARRIVYLTAGAAGMFCGSCMHDNAVARAMRVLGDDVLLQPVYTPIRTDELDIAEHEVFFGGIHVYLLQRAPWLARLPRWCRAWLDWPPLIRWATARAGSTDAADLGQLTLSMLRGEHGRQSGEVERLADWLQNDMRADAVIFTNLLIGGVIPMLKARMPATRLIVMLQGDDIFLDHLPEPIRRDAIELCGTIARDVDLFVTHSRFYAAKMGRMLSIEPAKFDVQPLTIDLTPFGDLGSSPSMTKTDNEFRVGYFARIAPEKGLHVLADAFIDVARRPGFEKVTLHVGGWLGSHNEPYLSKIRHAIAEAGLANRFVFHGSLDLRDKISLMRSFDVMSVPSPYADPKGLFVLEAWAAATPVIQPDHGAFPELIQKGVGGWLFPPGDVQKLANQIATLVVDPVQLTAAMRQVPMLLASHHGIEIAARRMGQLAVGNDEY